LYCFLSKAKNELNHTHTQLEVTREEVDTRTHAIVHLEKIIET
jgi:hypothetical protein